MRHPWCVDEITAGFIGVIIGSVTTLLAGAVVPIVMEIVRRRSESRRARIQGVKALIPELMEICADNVQRGDRGEKAPATASAREVRLIMQLEMVAAKPEQQVVMVLKMATVGTKSPEPEVAKRHLIAAMTVLSEWAVTGKGDQLYPTYDALVSASALRASKP